jgi:hypothetical protein
VGGHLRLATLIQIVLNREPLPLDQVSRLLTFLES